MLEWINEKIADLELCAKGKLLRTIYEFFNPQWNIPEDNVKLDRTGDYPPCKCCLFYRGVLLGLMIMLILGVLL